MLPHVPAPKAGNAIHTGNIENVHEKIQVRMFRYMTQHALWSKNVLVLYAFVHMCPFRFNKNDWSNYQQANDYSYQGSITSYTVSTRITVYYKGTLIWGNEPA